MRTMIAIAFVLASATPALAKEAATLERIDPKTTELTRSTTKPVAVWLSKDTRIDDGDELIERRFTGTSLKLSMPVDTRVYAILQHEDGSASVVSERELPLEQGSNFRDIGGYVTQDGKTVRWGKAFRSGAMPLLSEGDYALLSQLDLDSIVDLRSLEERSIAPDLLDDRTGAMFLANDYSLKPLFERLEAGGGENTYKGMEELLAPQFRMLFKRLLADEGAVVYHCSAGQDRTGIATALIYDVLGVDRETILKDYHLSTALRRPEWEMPQVDPADHPNNPILKYYAAMRAEGEIKARPLYTPSGASHLAQFFEHLDTTYGGSQAYLEKELGIEPAQIERLRTIMLR